MLTNNIAEWTAALKVILKAVDLQARNVTIITDSLGVVMGLRGMSSIREAPLAHILRQIRTLVQQNSIFLTVKWVEAHKKDGNYKKGKKENMREKKFYDILTVFSDTQIFCQVFVTISLMKIHFRSSNEK